MADLVGQNIGRYHVVEQLGQGGMAVVYQAYDTHLERDVAIKVIRTGMVQPDMLDQMLKRFEREAKSLAKMKHRDIVNIFDYGKYEGAPYLVMEYLPGGTLKERAGKPRPYQDAAKLLLPVARALEYAHQRGVLHRDVKPANILITEEGDPLLSDFGIAKMLEDEHTIQLTGTGTGIGTPEYMPPEQWTGKAVPQTDVYALGIVFYELITGRRPYTADTPAAILIKHINDPLPRPKIFVPELPDVVEKVLFKALAKHLDDRYESMAQFAKALEQLIVVRTQPSTQDDLPTLHASQQLVELRIKVEKTLGEGDWTGAYRLVGEFAVLGRAGQEEADKLTARIAYQRKAVETEERARRPAEQREAEKRAAEEQTRRDAEKLVARQEMQRKAAEEQRARKKTEALREVEHPGTVAREKAEHREGGDKRSEEEIALPIQEAVLPKKIVIPLWVWIAGGVGLLAVGVIISGMIVWANGRLPKTTALADSSTLENLLIPISNETPIPGTAQITAEMALPSASGTPTTSIPTLAPGATRVSEVDDMVMVYVPEGEFQMGQEGVAEPVHKVYLDSFWIDQTEVTNAMYRVCVEAGQCTSPGSDTYFVSEKYENHPVAYMNWDQASIYCEWVGRRLPTEAEWEKAARGTDGRTYPWGDEVDCAYANLVDCVGDLSPAGSYPDGASPYGALDMAGNMTEWVSDWFGPYSQSPERNPTGPPSGEYPVVRGGSWSFRNSDGRSAYREGDFTFATHGNFGFRCAESAELPSQEVTTAHNPTPSPMPTNQVELPVTAGTDYPKSEVVISTNNFNEINELAQWEYGDIDIIAFSPTFSFFARAQDQLIYLVSLQDGNILAEITVEETVESLKFSYGEDMLACGTTKGTILLYSLPNGGLIKEVKNTGLEGIGSIDFSLDDTRLITLGDKPEWDTGLIKVWQLPEGYHLQTFETNSYNTSSVSYDSIQKLIAYPRKAATVGLARAVDGSLYGALAGHSDQVESVKFSRDGIYIATGGGSFGVIQDTNIKLWETTSTQEVYTLSGHDGIIPLLDFSPANKILMSGSDDDTVRLWDLDHGVQLGILLNDSTIALAFSSDGKYIATASKNKVRIWGIYPTDD
jgi:formylglycine-generating enzyme required for sulfatase activity/WD40 repeat protein/tRNA A-37 threonylcarbamoyl transferase component Bud32